MMYLYTFLDVHVRTTFARVCDGNQRTRVTVFRTRARYRETTTTTTIRATVTALDDYCRNLFFDFFFIIFPPFSRFDDRRRCSLSIPLNLFVFFFWYNILAQFLPLRHSSFMGVCVCVCVCVCFLTLQKH